MQSARKQPEVFSWFPKNEEAVCFLAPTTILFETSLLSLVIALKTEDIAVKQNLNCSKKVLYTCFINL